MRIPFGYEETQRNPKSNPLDSPSRRVEQLTRGTVRPSAPAQKVEATAQQCKAGHCTVVQPLLDVVEDTMPQMRTASRRICSIRLCRSRAVRWSQCGCAPRTARNLCYWLPHPPQKGMEDLLPRPLVVDLDYCCIVAEWGSTEAILKPPDAQFGREAVDGVSDSCFIISGLLY